MSFNCPSCQEPIPEDKFVTKERLEKKAAQLAEANSSLKAAQKELEDARKQAGLTSKYQEMYEAKEKELLHERNFNEAKLAMTEHGIDADVRQNFFDAYNGIETKDKPGFSDWLSQAKEDKSILPKILQPFMPEAKQPEEPKPEPSRYRFTPPQGNVNATTPTTQNSAAALKASMWNADGTFNRQAYENGGKEALEAQVGIKMDSLKRTV